VTVENRKILSLHSLRDRNPVLYAQFLLDVFFPLIQKGLKSLKVLSTGDKTESTDHAKGYNLSTVRSTGIPCIAKRSDKTFLRNPTWAGRGKPSVSGGESMPLMWKKKNREANGI
jgi:hypothetical protein